MKLPRADPQRQRDRRAGTRAIEYGDEAEAPSGRGLALPDRAGFEDG